MGPAVNHFLNKRCYNFTKHTTIHLYIKRPVDPLLLLSTSTIKAKTRVDPQNCQYSSSSSSDVARAFGWILLLCLPLPQPRGPVHEDLKNNTTNLLLIMRLYLQQVSSRGNSAAKHRKQIRHKRRELQAQRQRVAGKGKRRAVVGARDER